MSDNRYYVNYAGPIPISSHLQPNDPLPPLVISRCFLPSIRALWS